MSVEPRVAIVSDAGPAVGWQGTQDFICGGWCAGRVARSDAGVVVLGSFRGTVRFADKHLAADAEGSFLAWFDEVGRNAGVIDDKKLASLLGASGFTGTAVASGPGGQTAAAFALSSDTGSARVAVVVWADRNGGTPRYVTSFEAKAVAEDVATARIEALAFASDGSLWLVGGWTGRLHLGDGAAAWESRLRGGRTRDSDAFGIKLDGTGKPTTARHFGGAEVDLAQDVAILPGDRIAICGVGGLGHADASLYMQPWFLQILNGDGTEGFSLIRGGRPGNRVHVATVDGDVVVGGGFEGDLTLGTRVLPTAGSEDVFLFRVSPLGEHRWQRVFGGMYHDELLGLGTNDAGEILVYARTFPLVAPFFSFGGPGVNKSMSGFIGVAGRLSARGDHMTTSQMETDGLEIQALSGAASAGPSIVTMSATARDFQTRLRMERIEM